MIGNVGVGHDGGGVGVDEDGLDALGFQRTAGLRAGVSAPPPKPSMVE